MLFSPVVFFWYPQKKTHTHGDHMDSRSVSCYMSPHMQSFWCGDLIGFCVAVCTLVGLSLWLGSTHICEDIHSSALARNNHTEVPRTQIGTRTHTHTHAPTVTHTNKHTYTHTHTYHTQTNTHTQSNIVPIAKEGVWISDVRPLFGSRLWCVSLCHTEPFSENTTQYD